jgi:hypothetical protein
VVHENAKFYIGRPDGEPCNGDALYAFHKTDFEPIPTETWRDVSDDCLTDLQGALCYAPQFLEKRLANPLPDGFRLVKKPLVNLEFLPKYAFFIEKRDA